MSQINAALASRAPATSEYERGRQDFAEQAAHMIDINRRPWDERTSTEIAEAIRTLAATSGTPAEHNPARAPHNKFASLWCDACPRPTSGTPATPLTASNQRMWDLLRYQRADLLSAELITMDEYDELAKDHAAVKRLEDYDALKAQAAAPGGKEPK